MAARRFTNLDGTTPDKSLADLLRWQLGRPRPRDGDAAPTPRRPNDGRALAATAPHLTWVGHATFLLRLGGKLIATDPIWSARIHTVRRVSEPGVRLEDAPPVDLVTVSHAHYDHLDLPTLRRIGPGATFVVPTGVGAILAGAGLPRVVELGWWESYDAGGLRVTLVPSQHWSMRTPWDRNATLWGGFVYESAEGVAWHAGDTAFSEVTWAAVRARAPRVDWAMLPIGAYDPAWFMAAQHMGPEEAVRTLELVGAGTLVAMHWGTYRLTDEPNLEPPRRVRAAFEARGLDPARLWVMDLGETRALGR